VSVNASVKEPVKRSLDLYDVFSTTLTLALRPGAAERVFDDAAASTASSGRIFDGVIDGEVDSDGHDSLIHYVRNVKHVLGGIM